MSSKVKLFRNAFVILTIILFPSCKEDTVQPELYGSISGTVLDDSTSSAIAGANITTSPPTNALIAGSNGKFSIDNIPVGNYTITAQKNGYKKGSVSVSVRENTTTDAVIFLKADNGTNAPPNSPAEPSPSNASVNQPVNLTLSWKASDPDAEDSVLSFTVYLFKSGSFTRETIASGIKDTTVEVSDLEYNTTYYWQVAAEDSAGSTSNSETWSFTTMAFPDNPLVYSIKIDDNYEIFSNDTSNAVPIRLTDLVSREWWARYNSRRSKIAFTSDENIGANIYTMNPDGTDIFRVTNIPVAGYNNYGVGFCWSFDDGKFFYSNNDKLYSISVNGSGRTAIATAPAGRNFREVEQSPQGNKLVVLTMGSNVYNSEIYLMNSDGGNMSLFIDDQPGITERPSFSLDGNSVMFTHDISGYENQDARQLNSHIFIYSINGADSADVSINKPAGTNDTNPRFSPDGSKIIFNNAPNDGSTPPAIWIMDADGTDRRMIVPEGLMPDWK